MFGQVARRLAPAGVLVGMALAGCNTVASIDRTGGVAVVEEETKEASGANISSLSEVIQRNPSDPAAYNTRGAAYARRSQTMAANSTGSAKKRGPGRPFVKGQSGNPNGRPRIIAEVRDAAREHTS